MADTRGTWSLSEAWAEKTADEWVPIPNVFVKETATKPNAGWLGGGSQPKLDKIAFDTDTRTDYGYNWSWPSPTTFYGRGVWASGTAGATHGYFSGGSNTPGWPSIQFKSFMTKLVYSTGVPLTSPSNSISSPRICMAAASADTAGYLLGGSTYPSSPGSMPYDNTDDTKLSIVDKITNSTDTCARVPAADLPSAQTKKAMAASAANPSFAYMSGGITPIVSTAARFTYSTETVTQTPSANNLTARSYHSSSSNGSTNFYWHGGGTTNKTVANASPANNYMTSSTEKTVMATDTTTAIPANGDTVYCSRATTGNSTHAYTFGGGTPYGITYQSDKMTYSNETKAASPSLNLQAVWGSTDISPVKGLSPSGLTGVIERWFDNMADGPDVGYVTGGYSSPASYHNRSSTEKINMATDTANAIVPGGQMPISGAAQGASFGNHQYGITATLAQSAPNWTPSPGNAWSYCYRFAYSTETFSTIASLGDIPSNYETGGRGFNDPTANMGYYAGGRRTSESSGKSYVFKYSYSGDTWSTSPSLNQNRHWATNAQDNNNAWMLGGKGSIPGVAYEPIQSYTDKMSFSSGTWVLQPGTTLANATAGQSWQTRTHRMTYNACGDETAAYWASGFYWNDTAGCTNVWKLTYATGTIDNSGMYTTPSPNTFDLGGGLSNASKGYFAGGRYGAGNNTVNKFSYSTETISALSPGMTEGRMSAFTFGPRKLGSRLTAPQATPTSSTTLTGPQGIKAEGYLIQGAINSTTNPGRSDSHRLDYSTETWSSSANSTMTRRDAGATSTTTNAYIAGGTLTRVDGGSHGNDMDKLTYATSTFSTIPGSDAGDVPGPSTGNRQCAAGNQTQGYWAFGPAQSKCSKLTYSNETGSNLPNLPWSAKNAVGVSKQTEGYYGSGDGFDDKHSNFVKITFSTDAYAAYSGWFTQPGGFTARYRCGSSSSTKAYIVGGQNAPRCMDVTPWATNSTSNSPTTFLQAPGFYHAPGQGSNEAGYFTGGGNTGNNGTNTEKITYSTDTTAMVPSAEFPGSPITSYSTGGPNMNGLGTNSPNVI